MPFFLNLMVRKLPLYGTLILDKKVSPLISTLPTGKIQLERITGPCKLKLLILSLPLWCLKVIDFSSPLKTQMYLYSFIISAYKLANYFPSSTIFFNTMSKAVNTHWHSDSFQPLPLELYQLRRHMAYLQVLPNSLLLMWLPYFQPFVSVSYHPPPTVKPMPQIWDFC